MGRITFSRIIADRARQHPGDLVVVDDDGVLTARDLDREATSLAHALVGRGVAVDDMVAVTLPNRRDFVIACAGIWRAGATPQPIDPGLTEHERGELEALQPPVVAIGARPVSPGIQWLPSARAEPDERPLPDQAAVCWKAPATSGSTGRPKVVRAAAPALLDPAQRVAAFLPVRAVQLIAGPLWHSAVFTYAFRGLLTGHRLVIMRRFDPARWIDLVEHHGATWGLLVPTMMSRLLRLPPEARDPVRLRSVERVLHMGAPCPAFLKRAFMDWLDPARVDEVYAGSESNGLTHITGTEWLRHPGSVGRGISGTELSIRDDCGAVLPAGVAGTVWMRRGSTPTYDYLGARSRRDLEGWDTLGDVGHLDSDGYLFIHDRSDDLINRGGEKIAPASVEAVLEAHPRVLEAAVYGVPDDELGHVVHAVVQVDDASVGADEIIAFARESLGHRAPVAVRTTDQPLRNAAGKMRRRSLAAGVDSRD